MENLPNPSNGAKLLPTLRQTVSQRFLLLGLIQVVLIALVARWQLLPQLESLQVELNTSLAKNVALSTHRALQQPLQAVMAQARELNRVGVGNLGINRSAVQVLADSHPVAESVFVLDGRGRVQVVAQSATNAGQHVDRIGLDYSSNELFVTHSDAPAAISSIYLSPVSEQATVAVSAALHGGGKLVMELSLVRLAKLNRVTDDSGGLNVLMVDANGYIVADMNADHAPRNAMLPIEALRAVREGSATTIDYDSQRWLTSSTRVTMGQLEWHVIVLRPLQAVLEPIVRIAIITVVSIGAVIGLSYLVMLFFTRRLTRAAERLSVHAQQFAKGQVPTPANLHFRDLAHVDDSMRFMAAALQQRESALRAANEDLEQRVQDRTDHLQSANDELAHTMRQLASTQNELVQAGKMAALGHMVAGIAHEMNTPVGNARLVASTLKETANQLEAELASGKVSRAHLISGIETVSDGVNLIERSLDRAASLVRSFKQVAVDQTSNRRRTFTLQEVVEENEVLLAPRLRAAGTSLKLQLPGDAVTMASYPGALGQVITNLIDNAIVHGYQGLRGETVEVVAQLLQAGQVQLDVRDCGRGIPPESLNKVFDPFFTTRMGQGGSGLGLSIVYGLVTRTLGGRISVESTVGKGTTFTVVLPLQGPEQSNEVSSHSVAPDAASP